MSSVKPKILWFCLISICLWFTLITSPLVLIWPDLSLEEKNKGLWFLLWINEVFWTLEMILKFFDKRKSHCADDSYEIAFAYLRSSFIFDFMATLP